MKRYETKRYPSETKRNGTLKNYKFVKRNGTKRFICETKRTKTDQNDNVPEPCFCEKLIFHYFRRRVVFKYIDNNSFCAHTEKTKCNIK
jgi:ribosomal protein L36